MAATQFMNAAELTKILQVRIPQRIGDKDPVFNDLCRPRSIDTQIILFEQRDSSSLFTPGRNFGSDFGTVQREAKNRIQLTSVQYGEDKVMDEEFMLMSREMGQFGSPIDLTQEQLSDQDYLIDRMKTRYKLNWWNLVCTGSYSALGPAGELVGGGSYTFQQNQAAVDWSNFSASTPLLDMRNWKLQGRGQSVKFNKEARLYMQSQDVNNMLSNTNPNDLGAKRVITQNAGAQPMSLGDVNRFFMDDDLPQIVEYDESYNTVPVNFNTVFPSAIGGGPFPYTMFIPQGTAILIGAREMGDPVCDYTMTPTLPKAMGQRGMMRGQGSAWSNVYMDYKLDLEDKWQARTRIAFAGQVRVLYPSAIIKINLQP